LVKQIFLAIWNQRGFLTMNGELVKSQGELAIGANKL
jgi:hypothetical protein